MNLKTILTKVGTSIVREAIPGGGLLLDAINAFLPDDKKMGDDATGHDLQSAVESLPPEQRAMVLSKEYDVEIAEIKGWSSVQESLARVDIARASTRPQVAVMMARVVAATIILIISTWAVAVIRNNVDTLKVLSESSVFIFTLLGTPTLLLRSYFGMRTKEKTEQAHMEAGTVPAPNLITKGIGAWLSK